MQGFPTVIVLGQDGIELDRMVGFGGDAAGFVAQSQEWAQNKNTLTSYLTAWAKDTTDVEWNYRIAARYMDRYQAEFAQPFWQRVKRYDPQDMAGYTKIADFNMALFKARSQSQPAELETWLVTETDGERLHEGFMALVGYYENQKDVANTVRFYKKALENRPNDANLMNGCAWFIYEQKAADLYAWGIQLAQRAVEIKPAEASIWDTLAWLLHADGQIQPAINAMQKAAELEPGTEYFQQSLQKMRNDLATPAL